jgi:hypothetical protein
MGVNVVWSEKEGVEVRLTFGAVFDPVRLSGDAVKRGENGLRSLTKAYH